MRTPDVTVGYETSMRGFRMAKKEIPDHVRAYICNLVEQWAEAGENNTQIANSLGIEKQTVGRIRSEGSAGLRVRDAVAQRLGISATELTQRATEWSQSPGDESQVPPPATGGLLAHREYPALRKRLLEFYSPQVVAKVDKADFGQLPGKLDWLFVRDIAEAVQRKMIRDAG